MTSRITRIGLTAALFLGASPVALGQAIEDKPDGSWVSLSGVVAEASADAFTLDYGDGMVAVEMDDWDWYGDAYGIIDGDRVIVYGRVDQNTFATDTVEAGSVYVQDLNTYFYANDMDEEDLSYGFTTSPVLVTSIDYTGTVTDVDDREFTLDTGRRQITVDTAEMFYNPLDDKGYQKIGEGDFVRVTGELNADLFDDQELEADSVISLVKDKTKNAG